MKKSIRFSQCLFFLFMGIKICFASEIYSQRAFLTIESNNQTIKEVLSKIEKESEYIFFYMDKSIDLNRKVSVKAKEENVEKILEQIFTGTNIRYYVSDRQIILSKEKLASFPKSPQQERRTISGIVQDAMGPIVGANIIVKGTTLHKREGNPYPRMAETPSGMLNAVGLQNKGVNYFVEQIYPRIKDIETNMIVNVSGSAIEDYVKTAEAINELDKIPAIELNISCPNVKQGGMAFGVTAKGAEEVVKAVRAAYKKTLIVKLSPNVTSIAEIARAVENGGADSVSLINTLLGMAIDAERRRPILSTITGGMSGAAVKPIALRMVWQVAQAVKIPVIGLGGIMNWKDAVEFMLAGASAIQIGTANFIDPTVTIKVAEGINDYLDRHGYKSVKEIIGALEV